MTDELKISDDNSKSKRKLSCNNKKEIISGNCPAHSTNKRRRVNREIKKEIVNGQNLAKKTIEAGPEQPVQKVIGNNTRQTDCDKLANGMKKNEIKQEQNKKRRRRRRKSPSSPYQLGSSKYYGVCRHKKGVKKKWVAKCGKKYIGYFSTEDEAAFAVDKQLDEMGIDRRFRNKRGSEEAIKIMKGNRRSTWNRLSAIKPEIGKTKDFLVNMGELLIPSTAIKIEPQQEFNKITHFGRVKQNVVNDFGPPSEFSNLLQIEPTRHDLPKIKSEYPDHAELEITGSRVPITTLAVSSNTQEKILSICNGDSVDLCSLEPEQSRQLSVIPSNIQSQHDLNQHVPHMANPVRMLLLWKSRGALSEQQYLTASRMLDGQYGEINAWSAKGLLDMGDIERLKAKLKEVQ